MAPARSQAAARFEIGEGTVARYKVREQLAGITFPATLSGRRARSPELVLNPTDRST
jgi:hypothetical protein